MSRKLHNRSQKKERIRHGYPQRGSVEYKGRVQSPGKRPWWLPFLLFFIGVVCIIVAFPLGDVTLMFRKAIFICLECIGLG